MNIAVLGSIVVVGLLALPFVLASAFTFFRGRDGATYAGAALALVGAVTVLHAFMGSVRLGTEWLLSYLDSFAALPFVEETERLTDSDRLLLSIQWSGSCQLGGEVVNSPAVFALLFAAAFVIAFCLANTIGQKGARWPRAVFDKTEWLKYSHRLVGSLGTARILVGTVAAFLAFPVAVFVWLIYVAGFEGLKSDHQLQLLSAASAVPFERAWPTNDAVYWVSLVAENLDRVGAQFVAGITIAYLLSNGRVPYFAEAISKIADIIGFWPPDWHPLAVRSYRSTLLAGIDAAIANETPRPVVLVGHSQGSVVAAWYVEQCLKNPARARPIRYLVTCGSPLVSLYQRFFPRYFDDDFFAALRRVGWLNLWRATDPIATTLPATRDEPLPDPSSSDREARGHSDYWTDRVQVAAVRSLVRSGDIVTLDEAIKSVHYPVSSNQTEPGTPGHS